MRRFMMVGVGSLVVAGAFLVSAFRSSHQDETVGASSADFSALAAGHLEGFPCGTGFAVTTDSRVTISNSGNATLVCSADTPFSPPRAIVIDGLPCGVPLDRPPFFAVTTDSHVTLTPSG